MAELVAIVVMSAHLLATNLASAGPLVAAWLRVGGKTESDVRDRLGQRLAWLSVWALLTGVLTGTLLWFLPVSAGVQAAIARLPSSALWFAATELGFSFLCHLIYAWSWRALRNWRWSHASLALLSATNLLYHFPPLMSVLGKLAADAHWSTAKVLDRATLLPLMTRSEILALTLHFILASFAVAAIAGLWLLRNEQQSADTSPAGQRAACLALAASALQIPVGLWMLVALPARSQTALLGGNLVASLSFLAALLLTYFLLQKLLTVALGSVTKSEYQRVGWLLVLLVVCMTTTLRFARAEHSLRGSISPASAKKTAAKQEAQRLQVRLELE